MGNSATWDTPNEGDASAPLNITVTSDAGETLVWRTLARQAVPMLERPEQFHLAQRKQLAQTICLLLNGDLELEDVFGDTNDGYEPGCAEQGNENGENGLNGDRQQEAW